MSESHMSRHDEAMERSLRERNANPLALLRHIRVRTKEHSVQLWLGDTHIANLEPDSLPAIALQSFAYDRDALLALTPPASGGRDGVLDTVLTIIDSFRPPQPEASEFAKGADFTARHLWAAIAALKQDAAVAGEEQVRSEAQPNERTPSSR